MQKISFTYQQNKNTSKRAELIKEIYEVYTSVNQNNWRKKENWKRYIRWLKENRKPNTKENQNKFRKTKLFLKTKKVGSFAFFLSVVPTEDLPYILSVSKDMDNRNQNMSGWLMGNLMGKSFPQDKTA